MANQLMVVNSGSKNEKKVALTFDDGPNPYATPKILDILKEHNCKATFFFIGRWVEKYPEIVLRARNEGHVIGGHTMYHGGDNRSLPYHEFIKGNSVKLLSAPEEKEEAVFAKEDEKQQLFVTNKINYLKLDEAAKQLLIKEYTTSPPEENYEK